jgi:hypothetical protein
MATTEQATTEQSTQSELTGVREQRAKLRAAMDGVEAVLSSALAGRTGAWARELQPAMSLLRDAVNHHIAVTEGPGGLFEQIQTDAPHCSPAVQKLHGEHEQFQAEVDDVLGKLDRAADDPVAMGAVREQVTTLIGRLVRHRQRGADLIHDAYEVDIGGG